jgi:hypothetical protein
MNQLLSQLCVLFLTRLPEPLKRITCTMQLLLNLSQK